MPGTSPATWLALALACTALAGCSNDAPADEPAFQDLGLTATEQTGIVHGIVVDETITPVAGAAVRLMDMETQTNEGGAFGFSEVEPGDHFVHVSKPGFVSTQQGVNVVAGLKSPPLLKILLTRDPTTAPYVEVIEFKGFIECSVSVVAVGFAACSAVPGSNDEFIQETTLDRLPDFIQSEMTWDSTQAVSDELTLLLSAPGESTLLENYAQAEGESPLVAKANRTTLDFYNVGAGVNLMVRVFNAPIEGTRPPDPINNDPCLDRPNLGGCFTGVGVTLNQEFTVFSHVFHNFVPTETWQFTVDGPPIP